jgi:large repetitive protein
MLFAFQGGQAFAAHVTCGDVITQDTTLDSDLVDCPSDGIVIGADGVTLDLGGHLIDGDGVSGPPFASGVANIREGPFPNRAHANVTIRGGTIREFGAGIVMVGVVAALVEETALVANGDGIALNDVYDTAVARNVLSANDTGISGIDLERNRFEGNVVRDNGTGLDLVSARWGVVARNRVEDNGVYGIYLQDGVSDNEVVGNRVTGNGDAGIAVFEGTRRNRVEGNVVRGNGHAPRLGFLNGGIVVDRENEVARNSVSRNSRGIVLWAHGRNTVVSNRVFANGHGIVVEEGTGDRVEGNSVWANARDGIHLSPLAVLAHVGKNTAWHNGDDGIEVASPGTTLFANRTFLNGDLGIDAVPGVSDGGGNVAFRSLNPLQCLNIRCDVPGRFK